MNGRRLLLAVGLALGASLDASATVRVVADTAPAPAARREEATPAAKGQSPTTPVRTRDTDPEAARCAEELTNLSLGVDAPAGADRQKAGKCR